MRSALPGWGHNMARKVRLYWDNKWDGTTLVALTEETGFPVENTQHVWRKRVYRTTDVAAQYIYTDLGATPPAINTVIIENHNIDGAATVRLIGSDNADTTGNTVTIDLTVTANRILHIGDELHAAILEDLCRRPAGFIYRNRAGLPGHLL